MTPDRLRFAAKVVEHLGRFTGDVVEAVITGYELGAETTGVTLNVDLAGEPLSVEEARRIHRWATGTDMQDDLRRWADELERQET